ncbi:MAG TPA: 3-phosphoshikimate 1-carboxyvinyltransferase [Gemmatimonadaceae bacterium]|nr:3-phosphoshikimate 1-carboxyvinyltransferase [Gemmatimonadaceae bacterium]
MSGRGVVRVPGDKSISHRALMLGALASGDSQISGILESADIQSTASVLRSLGVEVPQLSSAFSLKGAGLDGLRAPDKTLDAGNSGTTVRLMSGVVASYSFPSRFEGDESLSRRPMRRIAEPLSAMGAHFEFENGDGLPMTILGGTLTGISWNTRAASAQTKSAILLAGLTARVQVIVIENQKSRDHTERMLTSLGAPIEIDENTVRLSPVESIAPLEIAVPGDPSSAAFLVALAVLGQRELSIPDVCVNPTRTGFLGTLMEMGASIEFSSKSATAGDRVAEIIAAPSKLRDMIVTAERIPAMIDELPLLACVAAAAGVTLDVRGASELRVKESDRISAIVGNLSALGAPVEERPDGFLVNGARKPLKGRVITRGDHRIAMAFGVLAQLPGNEIEIDDPGCVSVSYPRFWDDLKSLR